MEWNAKFICLYAIVLLLIFMLASCKTTTVMPEASRLNTTVGDINVKLAVAFLRRGYIKDAKQKLLAAQKLSPNNPSVWYGMGYFLEKTGNLEQAKAAYERALVVDPKNGAAHNNYGAFLCRTGHYRDGINHIILAMNDPQYLDMGSAYENAGICAIKIPNKTMAAIFFRKALAQEPDLQTSEYYLAQLVIPAQAH